MPTITTRDFVIVLLLVLVIFNPFGKLDQQKCPTCSPCVKCPRPTPASSNTATVATPSSMNRGRRSSKATNPTTVEITESPVPSSVPTSVPAAPAATSAVVNVTAPVDVVQEGMIANIPEIGWVHRLARKPSKTPHTVYNPAEDAALQQNPVRYARSAVPKGSWKVQVGPNRWVTMDEVAFAYDLWFEQHQVFQCSSWMGVYAQQDPSDAFAIQNMLWQEKPDLVIEVGTNTGGGAIFFSTVMRAYNPKAKIVTLDIKDISNWAGSTTSDCCVNCTLAPDHQYWNDGMITFIQGQVTEAAIRRKVQPFVDAAKKVIVIEDASHMYPHTLQNLEAIWQWVSVGSYLLVQDTKLDRIAAHYGPKYNGPSLGPMRSVDEFVTKHPNFIIDRRFEQFIYSQHHRGWLKRKS